MERRDEGKAAAPFSLDDVGPSPDRRARIGARRKSVRRGGLGRRLAWRVPAMLSLCVLRPDTDAAAAPKIPRLGFVRRTYAQRSMSLGRRCGSLESEPYAFRVLVAAHIRRRNLGPGIAA